MSYVTLCFILVIVGTSCSGINWNLQLGISSGGNQYKIPQGYSESDYVPFKSLKALGDEIVENHKRLISLKKKIEGNSASDFVVKILGSVTFIICTLAGILYKIQRVKREVSRDVEGGARHMVIRNPAISQTGF